MGRTACTEPQCLYNGALYLYRIRSLDTVFAAIGNCYTSYVDCLLARSGWTSLADSHHNQYDKYQ